MVGQYRCGHTQEGRDVQTGVAQINLLSHANSWRQVQAIGACMEVTFALAPPSPPPYRIVNHTAFVFTCFQKGLERAAHRVGPGAAAPYATPHPLLLAFDCVVASIPNTEHT